MSRGSTDSDEDVPMTMKISSLMYRMNFQELKPDDPRDEAHADENEERARQIEREHQLGRATAACRRRSVPMVNAIAPNAPIGASTHDEAHHAEQRAPSTAPRTRSSGRPRSPSFSRARPDEHRDEQHLQDLTARERIDERRRDDIEDEVRRAESSAPGGIRGHRRGCRGSRDPR